ncbi:MAG TPA: hypothetical protein VGB15_13915, partial [Longimicrobium sp.]
MLRSSARFSGLLLLLPLAACAERSPVSPAESPAPVALTKVSCTVQVRAQSVTCAPAAPTAAGVRGDLVVGWQGVYVRLTSSGVSYNAGTSTLRFDVSVQNLLGQPIGTTDGVTADPAGVRVFFESGPTRTVGDGAVEVANEDGTGTFTRAGQPYFTYPEVLSTEETSTPH